MAPIGNRGEETNRLRRWVQQQKDRREIEEQKRLLYVACTRARQELHLLGVATVSTSGSLSPGERQTLLATSWPHLQATFQDHFDAIAPAKQPGPVGLPLLFPGQPEPSPDSADDTIELAASAAEENSANRSPLPPLTIRRLPAGLNLELPGSNVTVSNTFISGEDDDNQLFQRPEGSLEARALGTTVHAIFESAARMLERSPLDEVLSTLPTWREHARAILRNQGVALNKLNETAGQASRALEAALHDPVGRWILGPHPQAQVETSWTGWLDDSLRTLRVDRIFAGGDEPRAPGSDCLWIVDYKSASRDTAIDSFLDEEQARYQDQLHSYGRVLRLARGNLDLRLALYYPLMGRLRYWRG